MKPTLLIIDDDEDMINLFTINLKKEFQVASELIGSNAIKTASLVKPKVDCGHFNVVKESIV